MELKSYYKVIRILSKGYLPITLISPSKLEAIIEQVRLVLTNKDYDLVLTRLYLYYDMKLVTFGIVSQRNLIIQFPVFVQPYSLENVKKSRLFRGCLFSNIIKIKLFIADTQSYVPIDLNKIAGQVHLFKLTGELALDKVNLRENWIWDVLDTDWRYVCMSLNEKEINLSISYCDTTHV